VTWTGKGEAARRWSSNRTSSAAVGIWATSIRPGVVEARRSRWRSRPAQPRPAPRGTCAAAGALMLSAGPARARWRPTWPGARGARRRRRPGVRAARRGRRWQPRGLDPLAGAGAGRGACGRRVRGPGARPRRSCWTSPRRCSASTAGRASDEPHSRCAPARLRRVSQHGRRLGPVLSRAAVRFRRGSTVAHEDGFDAGDARAPSVPRIVPAHVVTGGLPGRVEAHDIARCAATAWYHKKLPSPRRRSRP